MIIEELRDAIKQGCPIEYTAHCQKRMVERNIYRKDILYAIFNGEIIEDYPLDENNNYEKSFPSCLILGTKITEDKKIHVVVGYNNIKVIIISAYYPDNKHWNSDYKTRR